MKTSLSSPKTLLVMMLLTLVSFTSCAQKPEESPWQQEALEQEMPEWVASATDGWRYYAFNPQSIRRWTDEEGIEVVDVWVTVEYKDNPGTSPREDQLWHIDFTQFRYRVTDSVAYDLEGQPCEA